MNISIIATRSSGIKSVIGKKTINTPMSQLAVYIPISYRNIIDGTEVCVRCNVDCIIIRNPTIDDNNTYSLHNGRFNLPLNNATEHLQGEYEVEVVGDCLHLFKI